MHAELNEFSEMSPGKCFSTVKCIKCFFFFFFNETIIHLCGLFLENTNMSVTVAVLGQAKVFLAQYHISGSGQEQMPNYKNRASVHLIFLSGLPAFNHLMLWDFLS